MSIKEPLKTVQDASSNFLSRFHGLEARRKNLVLLLMAVLLFSLLYNTLFRPSRDGAQSAKQQWIVVRTQLEEFESGMPDARQEKTRLEQSRKTLERTQAEIEAMEAKLPEEASLPYLLGELVRLAAGYGVDFLSIKPLEPKQKRDYEQLDIELVFHAGFSGLINYLARVESVTAFLTVHKIVMSELKESITSDAKVTLVVSTLLGESRTERRQVSEEIEEPYEPLIVERDPFTSEFMPKTEEGEVQLQYELSGILEAGERSTAIINNEVYRAGDVIGDKKILSIMPNAVVLTDGRERLTITLERA